MRTLQPVIWAKGTFLSPQHLQAQDRFIESVLQFRLDALSFRPWGFSQLQFNQEQLANGVFAIHRAQGMFPDGLPFEIPDSDPVPPARPIAEYFPPDSNTLDIYLAIPSYKENGLNVSMAARGLGTRYLAEVETFRDENTNASERPVQIARKNMRILVEGESRQGNSILRIARVQKTEAETYQLDPHFVAPLLDISASDYLISIARRLIENLSARSSMLSGMRRQKNQSLAEFTVADIANFWLLYSINTHFPQLRHLFETRRGHPEELFAIMASLGSALTTFSLDIKPRDLPVYDHDDLGRCFKELDEMVHHLLETVVPSNFVSLALRLVRPSIYAASLTEDKYLQDTQLYLAVSAEMGEADIITKSPALMKVCSANHIEHLIRQALPGMAMTHVVQPPATIPVKVNHQYFSLSRSGLAWEAVLRSRNIAVYAPADFPNPQLELIVLLPEPVTPQAGPGGGS